MGVISGVIGTSDLDTRLATLNQSTIYDAVREVTSRYVRDRDQALNFFVQETTTEYQQTYELPGGEEMQEMGLYDNVAEQRPTNNWTVAFPIYKYGTGVGWDDETYAYMTAADLDNLFQSAIISNAKTHRKAILKAILNSTNVTFSDRRHGSLTIRKLANSDGATYPPVLYADSEADDTHYLESNYAASAISDTNNPFETMKNEIREHWDGPYQMVALINSAQKAKVLALSDFVKADTDGVEQGITVARASAASVFVPGVFLGIEEYSGVRVYEWDYMPANYIYMSDVNQEPPLKKREHAPAELKGFRLEAEQTNDPLHKRKWIDRFGYGAGNRLNGCVMELGTGGTYSIPSGYS